ncbi:Alpha-1,2-mannosyltransferase algn-9 [Dirofilaria immitis]
MKIYKNTMVIHICIGKEWYRFPSSFFLPSDIKNNKNQVLITELNFVKNEFAGLLPKPYIKGSLPEITRVIPAGMNDLNREEISRIVTLLIELISD